MKLAQSILRYANVRRFVEHGSALPLYRTSTYLHRQKECKHTYSRGQIYWNVRATTFLTFSSLLSSGISPVYIFYTHPRLSTTSENIILVLVERKSYVMQWQILLVKNLKYRNRMNSRDEDIPFSCFKFTFMLHWYIL